MYGGNSWYGEIPSRRGWVSGWDKAHPPEKKEQESKREEDDEYTKKDKP